MAAATARVAAALSLGAGTALVASGGRASPGYSYVADALVGVFSWLDPEDAHKLTIQLAQAGLLPQQAAASEGASLRTKAWGLDFPNPVRHPNVATLRAASEPLRPLSSPRAARRSASALASTSTRRWWARCCSWASASWRSAV